jgi:hypothetical protein
MSLLLRGLSKNQVTRTVLARSFATTNRLYRPKTHTSEDFSFLPTNTLPAKPRKNGLTEIRGPYYAPVTQTYLDELLKDWGEFVDGVKFAGGSFSLMPPERLRNLIDIAHKHGQYL